MTLGSCLRKVFPDRDLPQGLHHGTVTRVPQPDPSDLHCPGEVQVTAIGPPLDFDRLSNSLVKPPRGNQHEALRGYVS